MSIYNFVMDLKQVENKFLMKMAVFWAATPRNLVGIHRRFRDAC
jgi:hypothetical protein